MLVVGVAASFTPQPLEPFLGVALLERGIAQPAIRFADFNQIHQACLDPIAVFAGRPDRLVLLWRAEDVFERDLVRALAGDRGAEERLVKGVDELVGIVRQCAQREGLAIVLGIPPTPTGFGLDPFDPVSSARVGRVHQRVVDTVLCGAEGSEGVRLVDHRRLNEEVGRSVGYDPRGLLLYRQPYTTAMISALAVGAADAIVSFDLTPPKVIVVDADNTLWGGVVGEDGPDGVAIGPSFPGNAFQQFQLALQRLVGEGVLLAVSSKNNADDVTEVFETRDEMVLGVGDIAAWRVGWGPKSEGVAAIAAELNVGLDSVVFVDDSDFELAEVGTALPDVRCLRVPDELADLPDLLATCGLFRSRRVTSEDRERTAMIHAEQRRASALADVSPDQFLASLGLRVGFFEIGAEHVNRVTQLINKTNQFNLTTRRRTEAEVAAIVQSPTGGVYAVEAEDRFGAYGLVGVVIVDRADPTSWVLDTVLMSCRVLRRGVESAMLSAVAARAAAAGARQLVGLFVPSAKNSLAEPFYPEHGFRTSGAGVFAFDLRDPLEAPGHIVLVADA